MRDPNNVVEFDNLHTYFFTDVGTVKAVTGQLRRAAGQDRRVVGESAAENP